MVLQPATRQPAKARMQLLGMIPRGARERMSLKRAQQRAQQRSIQSKICRIQHIVGLDEYYPLNYTSCWIL